MIMMKTAASRSDDREYYRSYSELMKDAPPGFRFTPSDVEMINSYLVKNNSKMPMEPNPIHQVELYHFSLQQLSEQYPLQRETEWYLFTYGDPNYTKGKRRNGISRAVGLEGYWKSTCGEAEIRGSDGRPIGYKRSLDYYGRKSPKELKTNWKMH